MQCKHIKIFVKISDLYDCREQHRSWIQLIDLTRHSMSFGIKCPPKTRSTSWNIWTTHKAWYEVYVVCRYPLNSLQTQVWHKVYKSDTRCKVWDKVYKVLKQYITWNVRSRKIILLLKLIRIIQSLHDHTCQAIYNHTCQSITNLQTNKQN